MPSSYGTLETEDWRGLQNNEPETLPEQNCYLKKMSDTNTNESERIQSLEKRLDDSKSFLQLLVTSGSALSAGLFAVLTIVVTWNLTNERNQLSALRDELKTEIKEKLDPNHYGAVISLVSLNGKELQGETVEVEEIFKDQYGKFGIPVYLRLINSGSSSSGKIWFSGFTNAPLQPENADFKNSGDSKFDYEYYNQSANDELSNIPGGNYSKARMIVLWLAPQVDQPAADDYPYRIKIYSERGLESEATVTLRISDSVTVTNWR